MRKGKKLFYHKGYISHKKSEFYSQKIWRKLYNRWHSMLRRCYFIEDKSYKNYGLKGVTVCERWYDFWNFANDAKILNGWNENKFIEGVLELDKDILNDSKIKQYNPENCCWVTRSENIGNRNKNNLVAIDFLAIAPDGTETIEYNTNEFAKTHNLFRSNICEVLKGRRIHTRGWKFKYLPEKDLYEN